MERTILPPACGEETRLPGIACVGCAAAVSYKPDHIDGFSVCVIASSDEVNLLGPDRGHGKDEEKLVTRALWRPPRRAQGGTSVSKNVTAPGFMSASRLPGGAERQRPGAPVSQAAPAVHSTQSDTRSGENNVKIVALLAFLLKPDGVAQTLCNRTEGEVTFDAAVPDDTMCIFVAWADDRSQHHVSFLLVSLMAALSPMPAASPTVLFQELDALPLEPDQRVLRLFYSHHVAESMRRADPARTNPLHLIMCSGYQLSTTPDVVGAHGTSTPSAARSGGEHPQNDVSCRTASGPTAKLRGFFSVWSVSGFPGNVDPRVCTNGDGATAADVPPPLFAHLAPSGEWVKPAHMAHVARPGGAVANTLWLGCPSVCVRRAQEGETPPWMWAFAPDRVVCCFDVVPHSASLTAEAVGMRAAAGTTDGRVYVLTTHGTRLLRRLAGPIADTAFVVCGRLHGSRDPAQAARGAAVDRLLDEAHYHRPQSTAGTSDGNMLDVPDVALVVLDSVGRVVYFLAVNKTLDVNPRVVCDVPQIIRLADRETNVLTFVDVNPAGAADATAHPDAAGASTSSPAATASSRNFLDISTLRHFFGAQKPKQAVPVSAASRDRNDTESSSTVSASGKPSVTGEGELAAGACAGHLLSRGLLRIAQLENVNGYPELVISTHGQLLVSIPYDIQAKRFYVAGFTITPSPMHYVQFVDIFGTGCEEIVFAGLDSVLVARRSRGTLRERALLLLQLVERRRGGGTRLSAASAHSVDVLDT